MNDKKTPIPLRASRKPPKPIEFPTPGTPANDRLQRLAAPRAMDIDEDKLRAFVTDEEKLRLFVHQCVHEQLREHDMRLVRTLHKVVMDWPIAEIMTMGEAEFEALCRSVLEDAN